MDTKFFVAALKSFCDRHKWDSDMPLTPSMLSTILQEAQKLKDAERRRLEREAAPTPEPEPSPKD